MHIAAIIFDLDGVIRHFDPGHRDAVERRHGLNEGALAQAAFAPRLNEPAVTGAITRVQWISAIGREVGSVAAVEEWLGHGGHVDDSMVALVHELRRTGVSVSVLTNGTDTVPDELAHHGIDGIFDHVFNSWVLGRAKPDPEVFTDVCSSIGVEPARTFFTDDNAANVEGARQAGLQAQLFEGLGGLRVRLRELGV